MPCAVLDRPATEQKAPGRPVPTINHAFRNAGFGPMPKTAEQEIRISTQVNAAKAAYESVFLARHAGTLAHLRTSKWSALYWTSLLLLTSCARGVLHAPYTLCGLVSVVWLIFYFHCHNLRAVGQWYTGEYDTNLGTFTTLSSSHQPVESKTAHPLFVSMTKRLDRELARVPHIQYKFVVDSYVNDPIGGVEITNNGQVRRINYCAWDGQVILWPTPPV